MTNFPAQKKVTKGSVVVAYLDPGHWSACFGQSYRDMALYDALKSQRIVRENGVELRYLTGAGSLVANRNKAAQDFLYETDGEWLLVMDTDMGFSDRTADLLVESAHRTKRPVMGALCFQLKRARGPRPPFHAERSTIQPTVFAYHENPDGEVGFAPILDYDRDSVIQCAATGSAMILIHRDVLVKIRDKYGHVWYDPITHPTGDVGGSGPRTFSEDLSFCLRCAAVDVPVHVNTGVKTTHDKGGIFLDEGTYDEGRAK